VIELLGRDPGALLWKDNQRDARMRAAPLRPERAPP
jgi:hypothetical protein